MKRFLWVIFFILILITVLSYALVPGTIGIRHTQKVEVSDSQLQRYLLYPARWAAWWPQKNKGEKGFIANGVLFHPQNATSSGIRVDAGSGARIFPTYIEYGVTGDRQAQIIWTAEIPAGIDPFTRISRYFHARKLSGAIQAGLISAADFLNDEKKVYGVPLRVEQVRDTLVLTARTKSDHYPSVKEYYGLIGKLREVIRRQNAHALDSPMLNVTFLDSSYQVSAGIPVDRNIAGQRDGIFTSKLIRGNILTTTISGGQQQVDAGLQTLKQYMDDHRLISPAIPFQLLLTNRVQQPDSTRWITKIYYPIF
ncbi:MAG: hypothetical protein INR69_10585 [Mucilaginibacter polytrichastri]|nr:hypothetical protein [Mucilaginibacter polytrichastri]